MARSDADVFIAGLAGKGLFPFRKDAAEDVALVAADGGHLIPCAWVELGQWGKVVIAWLAGTNRGDLHAPFGWTADKGMRSMTAEEVKQRLEFVRSESNVDVYRDKTTGQELYVGRTAPNANRDKNRHNELYQQGCNLIEGLILLDNRIPGILDSRSRKKLEDAIPLFVEVVEINPANWAAMWLLGKIYQRLGDYERGLGWFAWAHRVNPVQPDAAREASIAAMELGRSEEAIPFCERAIEAKPEDPGLKANLALALLFSEKPTEARTIAKEALRRDPADATTAYLARIIDEVIDGKRPCPHHAKDLQ
jgi:tetratricopeptide (TPR) repeat protein